jgi:hypothetical protein
MRRAGQVVALVVMLMLVAPPVVGAPRSATGTKSAESTGPRPGGHQISGYQLRGYQLRGYRWDAVLGRRWAVFEDAGHPERPLVSEIDPNGAAGDVAPGPAKAAAAVPVLQVAVLVVRSGDVVTLWQDDGNVRMQLAAVVEGNGALGQRVQLRVTGAGIFGNTGWRAEGIVRGPGSVEME